MHHLRLLARGGLGESLEIKLRRARNAHHDDARLVRTGDERLEYLLHRHMEHLGRMDGAEVIQVDGKLPQLVRNRQPVENPRRIRLLLPLHIAHRFCIRNLKQKAASDADSIIP